MRKQLNSSFIKTKESSGISVYAPNLRKKNAGKFIGLATDDTEGVIFARNHPKEDHEEVIVVIGLTGYEAYGSNDNGDAFPATKTLPGISEKDLLPHHVHKFVDNGAVHYLHNMADVIGKVAAAFWNKTYQWVELVIVLDMNKLPEEDRAVYKEGNRIAVSMGCDVPYDVCSHCYFQSKTLLPDDRCDCINDDLQQIKDGHPVAMLCPSPEFDDISVVFTPADAIAFELGRKVASLGDIEEIEYSQDDTSDVDTQDKLGKIRSSYKEMRDAGDAYQAFKGIVETVPVEIAVGSLVDKFFHYTDLKVPAPAKKIVTDAGLDYDSFLARQQAFIAQLLKDEKHRRQVKGYTDTYGTMQAALSEQDPMDVAPLLNIINKFVVASKHNESPFNGTLNLSDVRDVVIIEQYIK